MKNFSGYKKVLITGGAGFIGSAVVNDLLKNHYEVFVLDNLSFGTRTYIPQVTDDHFFYTDLLNKDEVTRVVSKIAPDAVVHLAAIHFIPYCNQHPFEASNINIAGTANLLDALRLVPSVRYLFFASTAAVYPVAAGPLGEDTNPAPTDIYGLSKLAGERLCSEYYLQTRVPTVVGRFFNAFGPNETNPHIIPVILNQILSGSRTLKLGNLDPKRDYIHTSDVADAVRLLMEGHRGGLRTFNIGSGTEYSVRELVNAFERCLPYKFDIVLDESQIRKSDRMHLLANITNIQNYIDWQPRVGLDEGLGLLIKENKLVDA